MEIDPVLVARNGEVEAIGLGHLGHRKQEEAIEPAQREAQQVGRHCPIRVRRELAICPWTQAQVCATASARGLRGLVPCQYHGPIIEEVCQRVFTLLTFAVQRTIMKSFSGGWWKC